MPRMLEIKTGLNLTIAGPARVIVYGKPALSGTQPEPQENQANDQSQPTADTAPTAPPAASPQTSPGSHHGTP
jgi:hypothetical protein